MSDEEAKDGIMSYRLDFLAGQSPDIMIKTLELLDQAIQLNAKARKSHFLKRVAQENKAKGEISVLSGEFGKLVDQTFWPGHQGNDEDTLIRVRGFYNAAMKYSETDMLIIKEEYKKRMEQYSKGDE